MPSQEVFEMFRRLFHICMQTKTKERGIQLRRERERQVTGTIRLWRMHVWGNCILSAGRCLATNTPVNIHNNRKAIASRHSSRWNISLVCPRARQAGRKEKKVDRLVPAQGPVVIRILPSPGLLWLNVARHLVGSTGTVCWVPQRGILNFAHELPK